MKIVILDAATLGPGIDLAPLYAAGQVTVYDLTPAETLSERIADAEVLVTNKWKLNEANLACANKLKLICVTATGFDGIDTAYCRSRGIGVCNVPAYGTAAVAQFTFALLLELCHAVGHHSTAVHSGRWCESKDFCFWDTPQMELAGKTMGIIGFGRIGRAVGTIAKAFGMNVLAYNRSRCAEGEAIGNYVDLDTLLAESDVVTLHCPLTPETQNLINAENIAKMKNGAILLNTARGPAIDEQAVADALRSGKLRGAAVDVISREPMDRSNPLLGAPNCIITPHMAWAPIESRQRIMDCTARSIQAFLDGSPVNVVNL